MTKKELEAQISQIEKSTGVELVLYHAKRSSHYQEQQLWLLFLVAFIGFLSFPILKSSDHAYWLLLFLFVPFLLVRCTPFVSWFFRSTEAKACQEAAAFKFVSEGVYDTKNQTGVLIYISEKERLLELLVDRAVRGFFEQSELERLALDLAQPLRLGVNLKSFSAVLDLLEQAFVAKNISFERTENEISNSLRQD